jgi:hypothetical protein
MLKIIRFVGLAALGGVAVCFFHLGDDFKEIGKDANFHLKLDFGPMVPVNGVFQTNEPASGAKMFFRSMLQP